MHGRSEDKQKEENGANPQGQGDQVEPMDQRVGKNKKLPRPDDVYCPSNGMEDLQIPFVLDKSE